MDTKHRAWVTSALRLCCLLMAGLGVATVAGGGLILQDSLREVEVAPPGWREAGGSEAMYSLYSGGHYWLNYGCVTLVVGCVCVVVAVVVHCAPLHDCGLLCLLLNTVLLAAVAAALSLGAGLVCNLRAAQLAQVSGTGAPAWLPGSWLAVVLLGLGSLWVLLVAALLGISYGVSTNTKQGGAFTQLHSV